MRSTAKKSPKKSPQLTKQEKAVALHDGPIAAIKLLRARTGISLSDAAEIFRNFRDATRKLPHLTDQEKALALRDGPIAVIKLLRARESISLRDAAEVVRNFLGHKRARSTMADVRRAKQAFDAHRDARHAVGMERCLVVVGYADGREPFRLLARVDADLGLDAMPDPPLTTTEMQSVAFAAKMAIAKVLVARKSKKGSP
jgi:ribosomal protein L7/L12